MKMNAPRPCSVVLAVCIATFFAAAAAQEGAPAVQGAMQVTLTPADGGTATSATLGADGSFSFEGLAPGHYHLALRSPSTPKQTQGASFGGLAKAASNVQPGSPSGAASAAAYAKLDQNGMPNRISMNMTIGKQTRLAQVDGPELEVEVGADGRLSGQAAAAADAAPVDETGN
ncbi:MAG: carboxypeptidase regulatory-like domain-containing protein [Gammaproteobacteria bacterium]|nr:MAG: carboxypeptidase regulatory-like domain-containing protein [Gammaproteobacteria bacterium]